ncbi:hypothetical protein DFH09DRAFT_1102720 [Mycena vulgaris]|nr:hypothetical protein DFH09DRAFT_1102720 [Mycena vulgaris]
MVKCGRVAATELLNHRATAFRAAHERAPGSAPSATPAQAFWARGKTPAGAAPSSASARARAGVLLARVLPSDDVRDCSTCAARARCAAETRIAGYDKTDNMKMAGITWLVAVQEWLAHHTGRRRTHKTAVRYLLVADMTLAEPLEARGVAASELVRFVRRSRPRARAHMAARVVTGAGARTLYAAGENNHRIRLGREPRLAEDLSLCSATGLGDCGARELPRTLSIRLQAGGEAGRDRNSDDELGEIPERECGCEVHSSGTDRLRGRTWGGLKLTSTTCGVLPARERVETRTRHDSRITGVFVECELWQVSRRAAARDRGHGSTAPVPRMPCPFRRPLLPELNGTGTARLQAAVKLRQSRQLPKVMADFQGIQSALWALRVILEVGEGTCASLSAEILVIIPPTSEIDI